MTSQLPSKCKYCGRSFTRKTYFTRHELACELIHKSNDERRQELEEHADTPTLRKVYELVLELAHENAKLKKQVDKLTSKIESKDRKKLCVIDWLNENSRPEQSFKSYYTSLTFTEKHLELIFKHDYIAGMLRILEDVFPTDTLAQLPIRSFKQKQNTLYIYTNECKWETVNANEFKCFLDFIFKCIKKLFNIWVDDNESQINNMNSDFSTKYIEYSRKVLGGKFTPEQIGSRIKSGLFKQLKTDLQNIVEYEFTF